MYDTVIGVGFVLVLQYTVQNVRIHISNYIEFSFSSAVVLNKYLCIAQVLS